MLTRHRDQSFIRAFKSNWPVNEHVFVPAPDNVPYLFRHTLPVLLILPVILCVTPPVIPTYTVYACVYVSMNAHRDVYIFRTILGFSAQMWAFFYAAN